jgi:tetratricopeptide (TPR) repeat protein
MPTLVEQAMEQRREGHDDQARRLLVEAVRRREQPDLAWAWLAHRAATTNDWRAALRSAQAAIAAGDPPWWVHHVHGVALLNLGRAAEAVLPLQRAADADPSALDVALAQVRCGVAVGDLEIARRAAAAAGRIDPDDRRTRRAVALLAIAEQRWDDAENVLRPLCDDGDEIDVEALTNLGIVMVASGRETEARPFFRSAMIHGEVTPHHRLTHGNFARLERRRPEATRRPRGSRPTTGIAWQVGLLRWLLAAGLLVTALVYAPLITTIVIVPALVLVIVLRRREHRAVYDAMPPYVNLHVPAASPDRSDGRRPR